MRRHFCILLAILFLANTTLVLAWQPPCLFDGPQPGTTVEATNAAMPDCHTMSAPLPESISPEPISPEPIADKPAPHVDHCEGLCLCAQTYTSPNFTLLAHPADVFDLKDVRADPLVWVFPASIPPRPLLRPPNLHS